MTMASNGKYPRKVNVRRAESLKVYLPPFTVYKTGEIVISLEKRVKRFEQLSFNGISRNDALRHGNRFTVTDSWRLQ